MANSDTAREAILRELDRAQRDLDVEARSRGKSSAMTELFPDIGPKFSSYLAALKKDLLHAIEGQRIHLQLTRRMEDRIEALDKTVLQEDFYRAAVARRVERLEEAFLQDGQLNGDDIASLRSVVYQYKQAHAEALRSRDRIIGGLVIGFVMLACVQIIFAWAMYETIVH